MFHILRARAVYIFAKNNLIFIFLPTCNLTNTNRLMAFLLALVSSRAETCSNGGFP